MICVGGLIVNIGIRLHDTAEGTFEERMAKVKEDGFGCGHLALYKMLPENPCDTAALTPGYAMYIKNVFAKNDIDCAVLGCYLNLANPIPAELAKIQEAYRAHIRFASWLGAGVVGTETGCPNPEYKTVPECKTDAALALFIKNLKPVVEYAEKMGVVLAIEPVVRHIVYDPKTARRVLDAIKSPNLGIIFDPVNLLDIQNYRQQKEICREAIEILGDDIMMIHIKDFMWARDHLEFCGAGLGMMDYSDIIKYIKTRKPHIHVTLEDTTPKTAVVARKHMEQLYKECN